MSAELLREAASLMRQRATLATPGPWGTVARPRRGRLHVESDQWTITQPPMREDAEHIASWHPGVALAVAFWLEAVARSWDGQADRWNALAGDRPRWSVPPSHPALAAALAYLGRSRVPADTDTGRGADDA